MVIPAADGNMPAASAERLRALVAQSGLYTDHRHIEVTISIGGTTVVPSDTAELILRRADALLYQAKQAGRDRVRLDPEPARLLEPPATPPAQPGQR